MDQFSERVRAMLWKHKEDVLSLTQRRAGNADDARLLLEVPAADLFPGARAPREAVSGLLLLAGCWEESHTVAQELATPEASYWHAIVHRMEPDAANAAYWFRRVGSHPIFPELQRSASEILQDQEHAGWRMKGVWDPFAFIEWCEEARHDAGGEKELAAKQIQQAEWRLLFEWCALPK